VRLPFPVAAKLAMVINGESLSGISTSICLARSDAGGMGADRALVDEDAAPQSPEHAARTVAKAAATKKCALRERFIKKTPDAYAEVSNFV